MNARHRKFVVNLVTHGMNKGEAYLDAGYKCKNLEVASAGACQLLKNIKVQEMKRQLEEEVWNENVMSLAERKSWLSDVARTPIGDISEKNKLCQKFKSTENENTLEMPSKIEAIRELNRLEGSYEAEKHEVKVDSLTEVLEHIRKNSDV